MYRVGRLISPTLLPSVGLSVGNRVGIKAQSLCLSNTIVGSVDINVPAL